MKMRAQRWMKNETGKGLYLYRGGNDRLGFWEGKSGIYVILAWCMGWVVFSPKLS
jgi:hypothetical protein